MAWTTLRDLTTPQTAEGRSAPVSFFGFADGYEFTTDQGRTRYLELRFDPITLGGTAPATAVTFALWRMSDGKVDRVTTIAVQSADVGSPAPVIVEAHGESFAIVVESFTGGTAPNVSTIVYGRPARKA